MRHLNEFPLGLEELARCCESYAKEFEKEGSAWDERPDLLRAAARLISWAHEVTNDGPGCL